MKKKTKVKNQKKRKKKKKQKISKIENQRRMAKLTFNINYVAQMGEMVCVTGSNKELGEWIHPVKLEWHENHQWQKTIEIKTIPFEYKYLIVTVPGDNVKKWEATNNRTFFLFHKAEEFLVNDVWDQPSNSHLEIKVC